MENHPGPRAVVLVQLLIALLEAIELEAPERLGSRFWGRRCRAAGAFEESLLGHRHRAVAGIGGSNPRPSTPPGLWSMAQITF